MTPILSRRSVLAAAAAFTSQIGAARSSRAAHAPIPVVGYLEPLAANAPTNALNLRAFREGLAGEGFEDGKTVQIVYKYADGDINRLPQLATDLVSLKPAVILASTPNAARPLKQYTHTIPIVFAQAADAVENHEVANPTRPEANLTGIANLNELNPQRFRYLSTLVSARSTIAYVSDPGLESFDRNLQQVQAEADRMKRKLLVVKAASDDELKAALKTLALNLTSALMVGPIRGAYSRPADIVRIFSKYPVPSMYYDRAFVDAGGLMSYGVAFKRIFQLAGGYVGKILKGAKVADLPVVQPNSFELVLNNKTAMELNIAPPPALADAITDIVLG